jgi:hypothetical protein
MDEPLERQGFLESLDPGAESRRLAEANHYRRLRTRRSDAAEIKLKTRGAANLTAPLVL